MPFLIGILGDLMFRFAISSLNIFARASLWNITLATIMVVATGVLITTFINIASTEIGKVLSQTATFPAVPYYLPSNLTTCLSVYVTVKIAGTVFNAALHFLENRSFILKA